MNKQLEQAIATATRHLSDEGQNQLARFILGKTKRIAILEAIAEADANPNARIPHEDVCKWVESWGSEHELPPPQSSKSNGHS